MLEKKKKKITGFPKNKKLIKLLSEKCMVKKSVIDDFLIEFGRTVAELLKEGKDVVIHIPYLGKFNYIPLKPKKQYSFKEKKVIELPERYFPKFEFTKDSKKDLLIKG